MASGTLTLDPLWSTNKEPSAQQPKLRWETCTQGDRGGRDTGTQRVWQRKQISDKDWFKCSLISWTVSKTSQQSVVTSLRWLHRDKTRSCTTHQHRENTDLSTAAKVEEKSCWPNHSRAHFLPPAWAEVNCSCSRLIFNPNLHLTHSLPCRNNVIWSEML